VIPCFIPTTILSPRSIQDMKIRVQLCLAQQCGKMLAHACTPPAAPAWRRHPASTTPL
jgi:hypothetical protein